MRAALGRYVRHTCSCHVIFWNVSKSTGHLNPSSLIPSLDSVLLQALGQDLSCTTAYCIKNRLVWSREACCLR